MRVDLVEKTIFNLEGFQVVITHHGKDVRGDHILPKNYQGARATKNFANVNFFKAKFQNQFPGYSIDILDSKGNKKRGNTLLATVRDTYLND